ncbi:MAG: argininosuccinate lyase, partial [Halobacteriales archaeon]
KGLPRAYNRDLQGATPHAWAAVDAVTDAAAVAAGAVATASWDAAACRAAAGEGFATATGVADALAMAGVPFRTAHEVVADAAERGDDLGAVEAAAESVLGQPLDAVADRDAVRDALDPARSVESRDSVGGPAPAAVVDQLDAAAEAHAADRDAVADRRRAIADAARERREVVATYG